MTIASNLGSHWVTYYVRASSGAEFFQSIGLHEICSSEWSPRCRRFPAKADCMGDERFFCSMWRSTGFLMALALIAELTTLVGFVVVMGGGKMKREVGWKVLCALLVSVAIILLCALSIVVSRSSPLVSWRQH
jgi:hypothetical protein